MSAAVGTKLKLASPNSSGRSRNSMAASFVFCPSGARQSAQQCASGLSRSAHPPGGNKAVGDSTSRLAAFALQPPLRPAEEQPMQKKRNERLEAPALQVHSSEVDATTPAQQAHLRYVLSRVAPDKLCHYIDRRLQREGNHRPRRDSSTRGYLAYRSRSN